MAEILVVGAGVIGLSTGIRLLRAGHRVTIRATEIPGGTSLVAAAMWGPYLVGPAEKVARWSHETLAVLTKLAGRPGTGVRMLTGVEVSRRPDFPAPVPGATAFALTGYRTAWRYTIPVIQTRTYLDFLIGQFEKDGGLIEEGLVTSLEGAAELVVNCAGNGARDLAGDPTLIPVRGQLVELRNPGITEFYLDDPAGASEFTHFLPHGDVLIAGGVAQPGRTDLAPDPEVTQGILERCARADPRLENAEILGHRVGLRPSRPEIRLALDGTRVIHHYGHGGAGISLSWGCADEVVRLIG